MYNTQFAIIQKGGHFYLRDLGELHNCRFKILKDVEYGLRKGDIVDFGKVVHYYVDKVCVQKQLKLNDDKFYQLHETPYEIDDGEAMLRSRPYLLAIDDPTMKSNIQNEILLTPTPDKARFTIGKHRNRDIQINLGAVSNYHASFEYEANKGWCIHENKKQAQYGLSTNGTYLFLKTVEQLDRCTPSDLLRLKDGMHITFINYEIVVHVYNEQDVEEEVK